MQHNLLLRYFCHYSSIDDCFLCYSIIFFSFIDQRIQESKKIKTKYPDRIPVVVEKVPNSQIQDIDKRKFLVPNDISVAQFMWIIRRRIQLPAEKAIFLFLGKVLPQSR